MSKITKHDTNGVKPLLDVGEFGYDNYPAGGDVGRVYIGTGTENLALAKRSEIIRITDEIIDANMNRADKWLDSQNVAQMLYDVNGDLVKIQYIEATDNNYETLSYTNGDLTGIAHYVEGVLKGNTVLSHIDGDLVSVVFTEV